MPKSLPRINVARIDGAHPAEPGVFIAPGEVMRGAKHPKITKRNPR